MTKQFFTSSVFALSFLAVGSAAAQSGNLDEQLAQCVSIKNPLERLVCFDKVAAGEDLGVATDTAQSNAAPKAADKNEFGREQLRGQKQEESSDDKVTIRIVKHSENSLGLLTIETADGQVWQQTSSGRFPMSSSASYFIEKGVLGSYFLGRTDMNTRTRVKRLK